MNAGLKIFLGDLVHTWGQISVWTMPLNVGYIVGYAKKHLGDSIGDVRLFKRPERMIEAIKLEKPDVVALSYYVWNINLNRRIHEVVREHCPDTLIVGGGPVFTTMNANEKGARKFFSGQPECDLYVLNQGERGFLEAMTRFIECGRDVERLRGESIAGCIVNDLPRDDTIRIGPTLDALRNLDDIPSPYQSGLLDEFFVEPIVPIIETNRSCPYRCTFCAWGIGTEKLAQFSDERVLADINYIADRFKASTYLYVADANFGILERDEKFAAHMYKLHLEKGFPGHVGVQWNKTRPDRVLKTAEAFQGISEVGASMQTLSPDVLDVIKRRNLPLEKVEMISSELKRQGLSTQLYSELILGLPMETREGHLHANRKLIDLGAEVFNYNLHLLPGTEMDSDEVRTKYFHRTGWRLHDNAFGVYDGKIVFEGQEVVLQTSTMSVAELRSFRFIHFLLQFMWGRKWYQDYLLLFRRYGFHPVDVVTRIADMVQTHGGEMSALYEEFRKDHDLENFASFEDLRDYWSKPENLDRLRKGSYGKLNYLYTYKILLEHMEAFNSFLFDVGNKLAEEAAAVDREELLAQCRDILTFGDNLRITIREDLSLVTRKSAIFAYDILSWKKAGGREPLQRRPDGTMVEYEFFLPDEQQASLSRQLAQFTAANVEGANVKSALRQMSIDTSADQFFYLVREVEGPVADDEARSGSLRRAELSRSMGMDYR